MVRTWLRGYARNQLRMRNLVRCNTTLAHFVRYGKSRGFDNA